MLTLSEPYSFRNAFYIVSGHMQYYYAVSEAVKIFHLTVLLVYMCKKIFTFSAEESCFTIWLRYLTYQYSYLLTQFKDFIHLYLLVWLKEKQFSEPNFVIVFSI